MLPEPNCKKDTIYQKETETELLSTTKNEPLDASTEDPDDAAIKRMLELLSVVMKNLSTVVNLTRKWLNCFCSSVDMCV